MTVHFISKRPSTMTPKRSFCPEISFVELKTFLFRDHPTSIPLYQRQKLSQVFELAYQSSGFSINEEAKILSGFENLTNDAMPGGACTFNILGLSDRMTPCICCDVTGDVIQGDVTIRRRNKSVLRHFIILFLCIFQKGLLRAC